MIPLLPSIRQVRYTARITRNFLPCRHASTSSNPYPYPMNSHPTPHQIFHLPRSASVDQVKTRYYELVRIYHPDSPVSRHLPPEKAQARFHAIKTAYDALRGKVALSETGEPLPRRKDYHDLSTAMWRIKQRRKADLNVSVVDDKWKDRILLSVVFLTVAAFVAQTYTTRRDALLGATVNRPSRVRKPEPPPARPEPVVEGALSLDADTKS